MPKAERPQMLDIVAASDDSTSSSEKRRIGDIKRYNTLPEKASFKRTKKYMTSGGCIRILTVKGVE